LPPLTVFTLSTVIAPLPLTTPERVMLRAAFRVLGSNI
jgi:hypothetical protein